jgi:hypothetical protein
VNFNKHSELAGSHAHLSASNYHWINYDEDKFVKVFMTQMAAAKGTRLHALAHDLIRERVKLPEVPKTLNMYVNDCIGWGMTPEQILFYTVNAFGTADAISFKENVLRISDLKTGEIPVGPTQLLAYAALFCLEYRLKPIDITQIELRIYQNDECVEYIADPVDVMLIIDKYVSFNKLIELLKEGAQL